MIKCIDLRGQGTGWNFGFFNTERNQFVEIYGKSAWNTFSDLADDLRSQAYIHYYDPGDSVRQYFRLCPDWVNELETDVATQQHRDTIYNV